MDKLNAAELFAPQFNKNRTSMSNGLFVDLFIQQNRIQTAFDKVLNEISTKQMILLEMTANCPDPKSLTRIGQLMGCSRQNVKQLADTLEKKGYLTLKKGGRRCVYLELTEKAKMYYTEMQKTRDEFLAELYSSLNDEELSQLYALRTKLFGSIDNAEEFAMEKLCEREK